MLRILCICKDRWIVNGIIFESIKNMFIVNFNSVALRKGMDNLVCLDW